MNRKLKNVLATVFVLALAAAPLSGCGDGKKQGNVSTSSEQGVIENKDIIVELKRKIYLVGEALEVISVKKYNESLGYATPVSNYRADPDFSKTAGTKNVKISVGNQAVTVEVKVYATAEDAGKENAIYNPDGNNDQYFKESEVIDVARKRLKKATQLGEDVNGNPILRSFVGNKGATALNRVSGGAVVWTATEANKSKSIMDPTRYSIPHTRINETSKKKYMYGAYKEAQWCTEMIFDAEGRLAYFATCIPDNTWKYSGHINTDRWYSHPFYEDDMDNPALVIEKDPEKVAAWEADGWEIVKMDPTDNPVSSAYPNDYIYEKVVPEGGFYLLIPNGDATEIWKQLSGSDLECIDDNHLDIYNMKNRNQTYLNESRGYFNTTSNKMEFYAPSSLKQQYAYYYLEAIKGNDENPEKYAAALEFKNDVYAAIVNAANPLAETEPVLLTYYEEQVNTKLATWIEMLK